MSKERKQEVKTIVDSYSQRQVEMKQHRENIEQLGWDMKYQNQFEYLVQSTNDMKRHLKISESFIDHIGKFRSTAAALVKTIVDELHLPEQERTLKPVAS
jgi:ribosomal protein S15P/S13E